MKSLKNMKSPTKITAKHHSKAFITSEIQTKKLEPENLKPVNLKPVNLKPENSKPAKSKPVKSSDIKLKQRNNPLHGQTLEAIIIALVAHFGWARLAVKIPINCFSIDPSITSSLKFLRETPWARDKVEHLYVSMLPEIEQNSADK